jgi:uncharacterized protein YcbX
LAALVSLVEIWRYPVKSMAGERLDSCAIVETGLEGDRRWALVDGTPNRPGKLLTIRQQESLMAYRASLAGGVQAGVHVDHRRFRANLYVDGLEPEEEIGWLGRSVVVGGAELEVVSRCERCVVITRDPETTLASPELLRVLNQTHETCMGLYCRVTRPGRVVAGNQVQVV